MAAELINTCSACLNTMDCKGKIPDGVLYKCGHCGSKKISIPDYSNLKDERAYGKCYREKLDSSKLDKITGLFLKIFPEPHSYELLDIGFGSGDFIKLTGLKGFLVYGLECDPVSADEMNKTGYKAFHGELGGDLFINNKFDIITMWDVLEHLADIEKSLTQLCQLTKTGGRILLLTPDAESILDKFAAVERFLSFRLSQRIMNICLNRYHLSRFSVQGLKLLLERYGFKIEYLEKVSLFSLKPGEYADGIAPGIIRWTSISPVNRLISKGAMSFIRMFDIRNKIFLSAVKC